MENQKENKNAFTKWNSLLLIRSFAPCLTSNAETKLKIQSPRQEKSVNYWK